MRRLEPTERRSVALDPDLTIIAARFSAPNVDEVRQGVIACNGMRRLEPTERRSVAFDPDLTIFAPSGDKKERRLPDRQTCCAT